MPQVDIIQLLKKDGGEKFYPVTHVDAVIGLENNSFFQLVQDTQDPTKYSVKLKPEYTGLWAEGWIAAGGIGTGGGGGGGGGGLIQTVYTWSDMQEMSNSPEDDTTSAFNAKTVYEIYKQLQTDGGGYLKDSSGGFFLTSSSEKILLKGAGHSLSSLSDVSVYNPSVNDLLVWSGYSWVNVPQSSVRPDLSGYVTLDAFNGAVANLQAEIDAITSFFEEDASHNITLKSPYQNLWVPGWMAAGGIGTSGGGGGGGVSYLKELSDVYHTSNSNVLRADGTPVNPGDALVYNSTLGWVAAANSGGTTYTAGYGISISSNTISLKAASENEIGGLRVKVPSSDPSSSDFSPISTTSGRYYYIQRTSGGTAFVNVPWSSGGGGGGGTLSSVGLVMPTGFSVSGSPLQSDGTITVSFASGYKLPTTAKQGNWDTAFSWGDHSLAGYVTQTGVQEISGAKTFKTSNVTLQGINLVPSTNNTCGIGTSSARFSSIYGTNANLSGNLSMGENSYIDIGNARIIYDSGAKALHIQGKTGVNDAIGLFADGQVSAGGVAAQTTVSFVTVAGNQTVTGDKEFDGNTTFNGVTYLTSYAEAQSDLAVGGDISLSGKINDLTIVSQTVSSDKYVTLRADRLYLQDGSNDVLLGSGSGKVIVGSHPGSTAIGSNKFYVGGTAIATAWNTSSDSRLKDKISPIEGAIDLVMALKPSKWVWNSGDVKGKIGVGLIAQDVEEVAPWMVESGEYKSLNYQMLHAYELSALQDHEMRIRELEKKVM